MRTSRLAPPPHATRLPPRRLRPALLSGALDIGFAWLPVFCQPLGKPVLDPSFGLLDETLLHRVADEHFVGRASREAHHRLCWGTGRRAAIGVLGCAAMDALDIAVRLCAATLVGVL